MKIWVTKDYRDLAKMVIAGIIGEDEAQEQMNHSHPHSLECKMGYYEEIARARKIIE